MAAIQLDRVVKRWGSARGVDGVSLTAEEGSLLVLLGPSGCGKSTTLRLIAGLEQPDSGRVMIGGADVTHLTPAQRKIAMVFQSYALFPHLSVAENIVFGLRVRRVSRAERDARLKRVADIVGLSQLLDRKPSQLSGGQRQRVALGRSIIAEARVCLMDEPLSNLDAKLRVDMRVEIKRLHQRTGATIVYVTHDQIEAMTLATRIAVLKDGELQQVGTPHEVYNRPANLFVADFMGSPSMNLLEGTVSRSNGAASVVIERAGTDAIAFPAPTSANVEALSEGARVIFGIRPEAVSDLESVSAKSKSVTTFTSQVEIVEPAGSDTFVVTSIAGKEVTARMRADSDIRVGQSQVFALNLDKAVLFDPATTHRI